MTTLGMQKAGLGILGFSAASEWRSWFPPLHPLLGNGLLAQDAIKFDLPALLFLLHPRTKITHTLTLRLLGLPEHSIYGILQNIRDHTNGSLNWAIVRVYPAVQRG